MNSSTPTYASSPASWSLAPPSDNSLGNDQFHLIQLVICAHNTICFHALIITNLYNIAL
jgi:hypothetical protein